MESWWHLILTSLVVAAGAMLQTASGMGMALFAAPLLALLDASLVPGPMLCSVVALSTLVGWRDWRSVQRDILAAVSVAALVGSIIGAVALVWFPGLRQPQALGGLILLAVVISIMRARYHVEGRAWGLLALGGTAAGLLGALVGAHGAAIALVLPRHSIRQFRATICAFFAVACSLTVAVLAAANRFDAAALRQGLILVPAATVGFLCGLPLLRPINASARINRNLPWFVWGVATLGALLLLCFGKPHG